jgi:DNA repair photolyase
MAIVKAKGNMYPWVTHMHSHLRGACSHACPYCYVQAIGRRFGGDAHTGPLRFKRDELLVNYGTGWTYFIEHSNDLFQNAVPSEWIDEIMRHCREWPGNDFVFQTRNTARAATWQHCLPPHAMLGTTIETNRQAPGNAPHPKHRARGLMRELYRETVRRFVTIEPILDFDVEGMLELLEIARPDFVNIGADSKGTGLAEPSAVKVMALIDGIKKAGIEIRQKTNLERILSGKR